MVERVSALAGHYRSGRIGAEGEPGVIFSEQRGLTLHQVAAWPETLSVVGEKTAEAAGVGEAPGPGQAMEGAGGAAILRVEPLKWWLFATASPELPAEEGATLDLSHSRTHLRIEGARCGHAAQSPLAA